MFDVVARHAYGVVDRPRLAPLSRDGAVALPILAVVVSIAAHTTVAGVHAPRVADGRLLPPWPVFVPDAAPSGLRAIAAVIGAIVVVRLLVDAIIVLITVLAAPPILGAVMVRPRSGRAMMGAAVRGGGPSAYRVAAATLFLALAGDAMGVATPAETSNSGIIVCAWAIGCGCLALSMYAPHLAANLVGRLALRLMISLVAAHGRAGQGSWAVHEGRTLDAGILPPVPRGAGGARRPETWDGR